MTDDCGQIGIDVPCSFFMGLVLGRVELDFTGRWPIPPLDELRYVRSFLNESTDSITMVYEHEDIEQLPIGSYVTTYHPYIVDKPKGEGE